MPPADQPSSGHDAFSLRAYLDVLLRRWKVVALVALTATLLAVGLSVQQEKQYKVEADLLLSRLSTTPAAGSSLDSYIAALSAGRILTNDVNRLEAGATRDAVAAAYDGPLDPDDVEVTFDPAASDLVKLSLTAPDSVEAAELVNTYIEVFIEKQREDRIDELAATATAIEGQIATVQEQIDAIRAPLNEVEQQLEQTPGNPTLTARRDDLTVALDAELTPLETRRAGYQSQLESVRYASGLQATEGPSLLSAAEPSNDPVAPKPVQDGILALIVGLLLGVVLAFLRDSLDERIRGMRDLEVAAPGLPVLGVVPEDRNKLPDDAVVMRDDPRGQSAEAFRTLRTAIKFAGLDDPFNVIQVTSALPGDGKTTVIANLAEAFAQGGERVCVICCDLRRPKIHRRFNEPLGPGLTDVLLGDVTLAQAFRTINDYLYLLPAGALPPNPSELLSSERAAAVIHAVAQEFDVVLLDCTPILPVSDALVVSRMVDATLMVVDARTTRQRVLHQAVQRLVQVGAPVKGLVLNGVGPGDGYEYGYTYAYSADGAASSSKSAGGRSAAPVS
ncbi:MAG: polysaccharide biosynthesis tyrosine autokinase [Actinomycetota bacterium]|nr:polysaccharide biosynthesis tyrosine autokinase [Actinomycetota bacterium]